MKSQWSDKEAAKFKGPLGLRIYTSRLLGSEPSLVLHGGGNTSVKLKGKDALGTSTDLLYVKGSGQDLAVIGESGFSPVRMDMLLKMAAMKKISDSEMVRIHRCALTDPGAPDPSIEAVVHAILPFRYVDHTHADAVVTISNARDGGKKIRTLFGSSCIIIPYVMPGFILAKSIQEHIKGKDLRKVEGIILLNHGVFTFDDNAKRSYEKMIKLVTRAEKFLDKHAPLKTARGSKASADLLTLASIRKSVSQCRKAPVIILSDCSADAVEFSVMKGMDKAVSRGPLTPDHIIRTKRIPVVLGRNPVKEIPAYEQNYLRYFHKHGQPGLSCLDPAPRWGVWKGKGTLAFGRDMKEAGIVADIVKQTRIAIRRAEMLGGWIALPEKELFEIEYWELEQAKLSKSPPSLPFRGKVVLITGAAGGIGHACVQHFHASGAAVAALDKDPSLKGRFGKKDILEIVCDVCDPDQVKAAVAECVSRFGGLDALISNAGAFTQGARMDEMKDDLWQKSLDLNATSHMYLLRECTPFLKLGIAPSVVFIGSKNVPAPGPGAGAYSAAKAALTQMGRIAALELGKDGIRVNIIHPNAVYDTGAWTKDVLEQRAKSYGISVEQYKMNNVLGVSVHSSDVARMAAAMAGETFSRTTGAQVPVDGGNERII